MEFLSINNLLFYFHYYRELDDELYVARGRISLSDLATNLKVDYSHVETQAQQLAKHDQKVHIVLGQLVNSKYLDDMAEQLNEKLQGMIFVQAY